MYADRVCSLTTLQIAVHCRPMPSSHTAHPPGLYLLFFVEMWERFSYYGMRSLLVLYLISNQSWADDRAYSLYGTYTSLVYVTPLIGGWLADRLLGTQRSLVIGGMIIALGHFSLAFSGLRMTLFYLGLALIIIGTGFFKPNVSTIVGQLYETHDPRRDAGFTTFYMGINLGALLGTLLCGYLGERVGWHWGFGSAGIGMVCGMIGFMIFRSRYLAGIGDPPLPKTARDVASHSQPLTYEERQRVAVLFIAAFFVILFWAAFEQAGSSMNVFALRHTNRMIGTFEVPASWFLSINPAVIILFAPLFVSFWLKLGAKGKEPHTIVKMGWGMILLGLGFGLMALGGRSADAGQFVSPLYLVMAYLIMTWGELCFSPIGLSMVTKLAPLRFASLLMGTWFLANAAANKLAGVLATMTDNIGSLTAFFSIFVVSSVGAGLFLLLLSPMLQKMTHGRG